MQFKQIIAEKDASLRNMPYEKFKTLFESCTSEIEVLEAALNTKEKNSIWVRNRMALLELRSIHQNLTLHKHYQQYCEEQDRKHYDAVYHRPLRQAS